MVRHGSYDNFTILKTIGSGARGRRIAVWHHPWAQLATVHLFSCSQLAPPSCSRAFSLPVWEAPVNSSHFGRTKLKESDPPIFNSGLQ
jgi:hypothetical protein